MKTDNIVIVGGGSAGWMTASLLIKSFPNKKITLIESENIPKVGVGESTYQGINEYLEYLDIDRKDFFSQTDASIKLAIKFKNFYKESGEPDFVYPFGSPQLEGSRWGLQDWFIKKSIYKEIPVTDFAESYFPAAHLINSNSMSDNIDGDLDGFDPILDTALHFDAIKFAKWLKDSYAIPRGVIHIVSDVKEIKTDLDGVSEMILDSGTSIKGDLYIDCTGFKSLLLSETLKEPFTSYNDVLPNTHAWATQIQYKNKEKEMDTVTTCTALKNGWCWNTPLWSRVGAGYVYSEKYIDHEESLNEFKDYLLNDLKIDMSMEEINKLEFKNIKMRVGIHERVWVKNVVAIGLSAGFIEPLEGNGLFSVHEFLFSLIKNIQREKVSQWDKDMFNYSVKVMFNQFVEFIRIHYSLSIREDSEYWKDNFNRSYDIDKSRLRGSSESHIYDIYNIKENTFNPPTQGGISWIVTGMNYMLVDSVSLRLGEIKNKIKYKEYLQDSFKKLEIKKKRWSDASENSKSINDYLKEKYYE
jgi:hypothetical protein